MTKLDELKKHLKKGEVYRRIDLVKWSRSVDRHLDALLKDGTLQKLSQGVYYYPKETAFGKTPPEEDVLVRSFLKDDRFLLTSPNLYNSLGVGTTQLYNLRTVYNHKRHGEFTLGNRKFDFQVKHHFPNKLTPEFLLVDLVNNLDRLAEDKQEVLRNVLKKAETMGTRKLAHSVALYGTATTQKLLAPVVSKINVLNRTNTNNVKHAR
ncbi:hypothetical protein [Sphingobacterium sp.]|jgi:hypothetical protein|uniref:hypothetical protein n=1 Tax=Sphingobacterium sp. TaxID=341027 RepID=UPI0028A2316C|nr:hypothetical protein [Sphingobacterium sp.]